MLTSSMMIENIPLMPMTPQIVIEIPENTTDELNYNDKCNFSTSLMNDLFIQSNNHHWTSGTSSPGSCYQNLLAPNYWSINQQYYHSTISENSSSYGNLKENNNLDKQNLLNYQSFISRTPSSISNLQYLNQNRNSYCCNINQNAIKYYTSNENDKNNDLQHSSSISLTSNYNMNKSLYLDNYICQQQQQQQQQQQHRRHHHHHNPHHHHHHQQQQQQQQQQQKQYLQSDRFPYVHRSYTTKSIKSNLKNPSNRSLSPYSFNNYPQTINLSKQCIPCISSTDSQYSDIDYINHSDNILLSKTMLTKMNKHIRRRASSPLSYQSLMTSSQILCNSSMTTNTSYNNNNNNRSNLINNYQYNRSIIKQFPFIIQRSNSLPELSTIIKYHEYKINSSIKHYKKQIKTEYNQDYWYKYKSNIISSIQSNYHLFHPIDLPCQQKNIYLSTMINHRRHTEGCSHQSNKSSLLLLSSLQSNRRSNSLSSQNHFNTNINTNDNITTHENIVSSMRSVNFINNNHLNHSNHIKSSISLISNINLDKNSLYLSSKSISKQNNDINDNSNDIELNKNDPIQNISELHVKKGDSFTRCLCSLIVLLVCMQLFLGIVSTSLGLFLTWKVPELDPMECAYLSGIPLIISGLVGTCICFQHRIPSISPQLMNIIQITSGILSLSCFILCLTTSIYTGQKEQLLEQRQEQQEQQQQPQHSQHFQHHPHQSQHFQYSQQQQQQQQITINTKIINKFNHSILINNSIIHKQFMKPCCLEIIKNVCECFIHYNKRIEYYHNISCHLLFSSIKDYIILQSALMCIGSGVSLWLWLLFIENKLKYYIINKYTRISFSSTRSYSIPEISIEQYEEKTTTNSSNSSSSIDIHETQ
ncbi:unnamed protein product [Schistosoma spindalis]|nr:unnamed protein product [Schistosoma spindale]